MEDGNFANATDPDFIKLWQDASSRWLRPSEVYGILINSHRFSICKELLNLPPSGTLVLFDRKLLRNFRRDGHPWRKKKDNKTVKEAHEHLKVGSEEKIHVYYAHGEGDANLQRRVYWLLDKDLEHIVLVHYLEVKELKTNMSLHQSTTPAQIMQHECNKTHKSLMDLDFTGAGHRQSSGSSAGPRSEPSLEISELNSNLNEDFDVFSVEDLRSTGETGFVYASLGSGFLNSRTSAMPEQVSHQDGGNINGNYMNWISSSHMVDNRAKLFGHGEESTITASDMPISDYCLQKEDSDGGHAFSQGPYKSQVCAPETSCLSTTFDSCVNLENINHNRRENCASNKSDNVDLGSQLSWLDNDDEVLKKLDSLDRWMQRELPVENKTSPVAPSINSSSVIRIPMYKEEIMQDRAQPPLHSGVSEEMTPSFKSHPFFDITEYSPTWGFSAENTKVIVTGHFNGDSIDFEKVDWCCIFGEKQVQVELVQMGVLKFTTPKNVAPGSVLFYIGTGVKQPCSDVKQFELKENFWMQQGLNDASVEKGFEDAILEYKLAHLLLNIDHEKSSQDHLTSMPSELLQIIDKLDREWVQLDTLLGKQTVTLAVVKDRLLELILKSLIVNSVCKGLAEEMKSWRCFDTSGQTILHLASALGYEWVLNMLKNSGMSIDFRDKQGWTALHWAAYYGREKMVAELLAAGAKPGSISDPTPEHKIGCTPADVASLAGHSGLAGYLSEQDLVSHIHTLTLAENDRDKQSANDEGHRVIDYLRRSMSLRRSIVTAEDELALEDSLSAIGNATISSARLHAAFKEYFMRERLHAIEEGDEFGVSIEEQIAVQKIQRAYRNHRERKRKESAALQIQNRFRGWKTRKNFLKMRQNVIKIQAYFRMHRVRKQYHKILWSVGILEKAVLRWRQRGKGLRGYQPETPTDIDGKDGNEFLHIGRKQAEEALDRAVLLVQSMVRSKLARLQYRRMKENFEQAKACSLDSKAIDEVMRENNEG